MNVEDNWYFLRVIVSLIVIIEHPVMRMFCFVFFQVFHFFSARPTETGGCICTLNSIVGKKCFQSANRFL